MKKVFVGLCMLLFIGSVFANTPTDYYCPTMIAIYGICSPELVLNFLAHRSDAWKPTSRVKSVEARPTIVASANTLLPLSGKPEPQKEESKCWYYTPEGWKKCRMVS